MKFLFNLTEQTLKITRGEYFLVLSEPFYTLGGIVFTLDYSEPPACWIAFSVRKESVRVIYKNSGTSYQREIARPASGIIEVEFSERDKLKNHD